MTSKEKWASLAPRVSTALILALISLGLIWWGRLPFFTEVVVLALAGSCEIFDLLERQRLRPLRRSGTLATLLLLLAAWTAGLSGLAHATLLSLLIILMLCVLRSGVRCSVTLDGAVTVLAVMYIGWLFGFLILLRGLPHGAAWISLLVSLSAMTDTGAYFVGRIFGRHPLWPALSPKKTLEGSLGGLLLPAALGYVLVPYLGLDPIHGICMGVGVSLVGQLGDLWESALKREVGVKDAGEFLGSHGGVLDRFDSLAFAAPFFYLYVTYVLR
jgi:phosphatidate cytidylyltransferase